MKRFIRILGAMTAAIMLIGLPIAASATIVGTAHDAQLGGWNSNTGEICVVCHTPHNADGTVADAPLWNHELSVATYTPYSNPATLDATDVAQPAGISKLCLSCHDGSVAVDSFGGATGTQTIGTINADAEVGTDLSNDHPISFTYDDGLATTDGELWPPTVTVSGLGLNIDDDMLFGAGNNQLECASCHDPHDNTNAPFLRKSNASSALCLTCHDK